MNRTEILERAGSAEDRAVLARFLDLMDSVVKKHETIVTDFYNPQQQSLISPVLLKVPGISFVWDGGFAAAERRRLAAGPDYLAPEDLDTGLEVVSVTGNLKFQELTHRDYLGAVLGLGIKREKIGDIIVTPEGCQIIADRDISGYIAANLTKVYRVRVKAEKSPIGQLRLPEEKVTEFSVTVSSLRLDAVAAAGFGMSRGKMADEIKAEKVRVNWIVTRAGDQNVREGDLISVRGKGRLEITEVRGVTRKGRISLSLKRYQ